MRFKYVLCDLDGTLTDSAPGITNCIRYALDRLGRPDVRPEELLWTLGPPINKWIGTLLETTDEVEIQRGIDLYRERFASTGWQENSVYPGVPEALDILKRAGVRLFVATSKPKVFAEKILDHFDLAESFETIYGSELDGTRSSKSELLAHLLKHEGLDPTDCLMIGDREHDVLGAKSNGIICLGVTHGYGSPKELTDAGAIALAADPADWPPYVLGPAGTL